MNKVFSQSQIFENLLVNGTVSIYRDALGADRGTNLLHFRVGK